MDLNHTFLMNTYDKVNHKIQYQKYVISDTISALIPTITINF